jgi:hypothetical protein
MRKVIGGIVASALVLTVVGTAVAAVTFNAETGFGFAGKGDVQMTLNWNNKQLQDNATSVRIRATTVSGTEQSWTCEKDNENTQVRNRTSETNVSGVFTVVARERNQITGFHLNGYTNRSSSGLVTEGPALNSCPTFWTLTVPAGDGTPYTGDSVLEISGDEGLSWTALSTD